MAFTNQAALEAVVADYLNRTDLSSQITDAVTLCAARLKRAEACQTLTSQSLTLDAATVSLPSDFQRAHSLFYDGSYSAYGPIEITSHERVASYRGQFGPSGMPQVAAILYDALELYLAPTPSVSYTATLIYDAGVTQATLLSDFPDLYLYGTLIEMAPFIRDDDRIPMWEQRFQTALEEVRRYNERATWRGNSPVIRPRRALGE